MRGLQDWIEAIWAVLSMTGAAVFTFIEVNSVYNHEVSPIGVVILGLALSFTLGSSLFFIGLPLIDLVSRLVQAIRPFKTKERTDEPRATDR